MLDAPDDLDVKPPVRVYIPWGWSPETGWDDPRIQLGADRLGTAIRAARQRRRLSQRGLAARTGVDQSTISRLERGMLRSISLRRLAALIGVLDDVFR
jgi:ribosome-binding protein aMBF1 (putative translation factor)